MAAAWMPQHAVLISSSMGAATCAVPWPACCTKAVAHASQVCAGLCACDGGLLTSERHAWHVAVKVAQRAEEGDEAHGHAQPACGAKGARGKGGWVEQSEGSREAGAAAAAQVAYPAAAHHAALGGAATTAACAPTANGGHASLLGSTPPLPSTPPDNPALPDAPRNMAVLPAQLLSGFQGSGLPLPQRRPTMSARPARGGGRFDGTASHCGWTPAAATAGATAHHHAAALRHGTPCG